MASNRIRLFQSTFKHLHASRLIHKPNQIWKPPDYLVTYKKTSEDYLKEKFNNAVSFYQEFTGLRELREAQCRVLVATEMLKDAQDRRRDAKIPLADAQKRLQDIQQELRNTPREDDRYIILIRDEHGLMKDLRVLQQNLQEAENDERDCFDQLGASLRSSHEAERVQAEKTKYFSIIASIVGTIIGVIGTSINNQYRMRELKNMVIDSLSGRSEINQGIIDTLELLNRKFDDGKINKGNEILVDKRPAPVLYNEVYLKPICLAFVIGYIVSKLF